MVTKALGVVSRAKGAPVGIEEILIPDPGPGEVLVRVQACGVCHTDLHCRQGAINDDFPFLLGHGRLPTPPRFPNADRRLPPGPVRLGRRLHLDGQSFDVTNNIWLVGDDREVIVIDAAHDAATIVTATALVAWR